MPEAEDELLPLIHEESGRRRGPVEAVQGFDAAGGVVGEGVDGATGDEGIAGAGGVAGGAREDCGEGEGVMTVLRGLAGGDESGLELFAFGERG